MRLTDNNKLKIKKKAKILLEKINLIALSTKNISTFLENIIPLLQTEIHFTKDALCIADYKTPEQCSLTDIYRIYPLDPPFEAIFQSKLENKCYQQDEFASYLFNEFFNGRIVKPITDDEANLQYSKDFISNYTELGLTRLLFLFSPLQQGKIMWFCIAREDNAIFNEIDKYFMEILASNLFFLFKFKLGFFDNCFNIIEKILKKTLSIAEIDTIIKHLKYTIITRKHPKTPLNDTEKDFFIAIFQKAYSTYEKEFTSAYNKLVEEDPDNKNKKKYYLINDLEKMFMHCAIQILDKNLYIDLLAPKLIRLELDKVLREYIQEKKD